MSTTTEVQYKEIAEDWLEDGRKPYWVEMAMAILSDP